MRVGETEAWLQYRSDPTRYTPDLLKFYDHLIIKWLADSLIKYGRILTLEEYRTELVKGVVQSFSRFDPTKGVKFSSFAATRAKNQICDYMRQIDPLTRRERKENTIEIVSIDEKDGEGKATQQYASMMSAVGSNIENAEFWHKAYNTINKRQGKRPLWLALNAIYRDGWKQRELAKFMCVSEAAVSQWVRDVHEILRTSTGIRKFIDGENSHCFKIESSLKRPRRGTQFSFPRKGKICCKLDCSKPAKFRGMCRNHYIKQGKRCSIDGCNNAVDAKGLCAKHYASLVRHGDATKARPKVNTCQCGCLTGFSGICVKCRMKNVHKQRMANGYYEKRRANAPQEVKDALRVKNRQRYAAAHATKAIFVGENLNSHPLIV